MILSVLSKIREKINKLFSKFLGYIFIICIDISYDEYVHSSRIFIHSVVNIFYNKGNAKISECVKF